MRYNAVSNPLRLEGDEQEYKKFLVLAEVSNPLRLEGDEENPCHFVRAAQLVSNPLRLEGDA